MTAEQFFSFFLEELKENNKLHAYYKFHKKDKSFAFRKAYFCQRLQYIIDHLENKSLRIWDVGCGYGTTAIFLALNGFKIYGSTLEFYYDVIPSRIKFWSRHGEVSGFRFDYENLFDMKVSPNSYDVIIAQDTLHHLEPLQNALQIFYYALSGNGKLIAIEENGKNLVKRLKLYLQRGNKRIIEFHDKKLNKKILLGNENVRSLQQWENEFRKKSFVIPDEKVQFIRLFPPVVINEKNYSQKINQEDSIWRRNTFLRDYFFFGINFLAVK